MGKLKKKKNYQTNFLSYYIKKISACILKPYVFVKLTTQGK